MDAERRTPQLRLDTSEQFHHLEGFGDVIVRPEPQAGDLVDHLPFRGEHDHRRVDAALSEIAQHVEAIEARKHHVEQHQIEGRPGSPLEAAFAV